MYRRFEEITGEKIFKFQIPKTKQLTIFNLRYLLFFKIYVLFGIGRLKFCIFTMTDINLGDVVRLKKQHPCGGYDWKVTRLGADIGLECLTCGHRVMLTRRELARRTKTIHRAEPDTFGPDSQHLSGTLPGDKHANSE